MLALNLSLSVIPVGGRIKNRDVGGEGGGRAYKFFACLWPLNKHPYRDGAPPRLERQGPVREEVSAEREEGLDAKGRGRRTTTLRHVLILNIRHFGLLSHWAIELGVGMSGGGVRRGTAC